MILRLVFFGHFRLSLMCAVLVSRGLWHWSAPTSKPRCCENMVDWCRLLCLKSISSIIPWLWLSWSILRHRISSCEKAWLLGLCTLFWRSIWLSTWRPLSFIPHYLLYPLWNTENKVAHHSKSLLFGCTIYALTSLYQRLRSFLLVAVEHFCGNIEMCRLTEQVIFTEPYMKAANNRWSSPHLDSDVQALQEDAAAKLEIAGLKSK